MTMNSSEPLNIADTTIENLADYLGYTIYAGTTTRNKPGLGLKKNGIVYVKPMPPMQLKRRLVRAAKRMVDKDRVKSNIRTHARLMTDNVEAGGDAGSVPAHAEPGHPGQTTAPPVDDIHCPEGHKFGNPCLSGCEECCFYHECEATAPPAEERGDEEL